MVEYDIMLEYVPVVHAGLPVTGHAHDDMTLEGRVGQKKFPCETGTTNAKLKLEMKVYLPLWFVGFVVVRCRFATPGAGTGCIGMRAWRWKEIISRTSTCWAGICPRWPLSITPHTPTASRCEENACCLPLVTRYSACWYHSHSSVRAVVLHS